MAELTNRRIKGVQAFLILDPEVRHLYSSLVANGVMDQTTIMALRFWQGRHGLNITGLIDEPTINEMYSGQTQVPLWAELIHIQAWLILEGLIDNQDYVDNLVADGEYGEGTLAGLNFMAMISKTSLPKPQPGEFV